MTSEQEGLEDKINNLEPLRIICETDEEYEASWGDLLPYKREIFNWLSKPIEGEVNK